MAPLQNGIPLVYGPDPQQFGELWLPAGGQPAPLLVFFHGGFWRARYDLAHARDFCAGLAREGIAVWSVEYRRVGNPGGGWPGTLDDVLLALSHLCRLVGRHELDLERVVLCGHSAGGHLALWAAAQVAHGAAALSGLRGVVGLAPVSDLHETWELHLSNDAVAGLLGGTPDEVPGRYAAASPASLLPLGIPQVLVHGTDDDTVPLAMSRGYVERAGRLGDPALLRALAGYGHFDVIDPRSPAFAAVLQSIREVVG